MSNSEGSEAESDENEAKVKRGIKIGKINMQRYDQNDENILEFYKYLRKNYNSDHPWEDPEFPQEEKLLWKRGELQPSHFKDYEIEFKAPESDTEEIFFFWTDHSANIANEFKIKRGILNDKFFIGAVLMLFRRREEYFKNLVLDYENIQGNIKAGFCGFTFFINGEWRNVTVDTKLPWHQEDEIALSMANCNKTSFWLSLLEKAYAKIYKSYDVLNGVSIKNILVDLTGGVAKKFNINKEKLDDNGKKLIYEEIKRSLNHKYLIGCMKFEIGGDSNVIYI
jgi:hypothetical protein